MKFPKPIPVSKIAKSINAEIIGNPDNVATGINEIHKVEEGDIIFVDVEKYFKKSLESAATIIILNKKVDCPEGKTLLVCKNPFKAYDALVKNFRPDTHYEKSLSDSSQIHLTAILDRNVVIGHHVSIGKNCRIHSNVVIEDYTIIGDNVEIQANTTIGSDAFDFKSTKKGYQKWTSGGRVIIENDVLIGANCSIAKGVSGDTVIGAGSKLDGQIHIGHGVVIGKNCLMAAQVGIGGKTIIGDNVILYGQVGISQNIIIGDNVVVLAKSGISKNLKSDMTYFGYPAQEARVAYKELAVLRMMGKK